MSLSTYPLQTSRWNSDLAQLDPALTRMQRPAGGARNPANSPNATASQDLHRCGLCNKCFERRDLRDRHKRRCVQALSRPLQDRRADEERVIQQPYAENEETNQHLFGQQSSGASDNETLSLADPQFSLSMADMRMLLANAYDAALPKVSSIAANNLSTSLDPMDENNETFSAPTFQPSRSPLRAQEHVRARAEHESQQIDWPLGRGMSLENSLGNSSRDHQSDIDHMSEWRQSSGPASTSIPTDVESLSNWRAIQWLSKTAENGSDKNQQMSWGDDTLQGPMLGQTNGSAFDLLGSFGMPGSRPATSTIRRSDEIPSSSIVPTFEPVSWKPPLPWGSNATAPSLSQKAQSFARNHPNMTSQSDDELPEKHRAAQSKQTRRQSKAAQPEPIDNSRRSLECPFHKMGTDDDLVKLLSKYPQMMLKRGTYPPFVHHRLYRCVEGDVLEPLANAFCCVSAHNAALPSSATFVHALMNKERDRLVKSFRLWGNSDIEALAAVHAMSVYQIVGFFGSTAEQARCAELRHHFFLKMSRRLTQQHLLRPSEEADTDESAWRKWIIHESIRRTAFLVDIINNLSCRTQKQNPYFYESLDPDLILNMPLPAPDAMWRAASPEEWIAARNSLGPAGSAQLKLTAKLLRKQYDGNGANKDDDEVRSGGGTGRNIRESAAFSQRVEFDDLQEFTRLIMASLSVNEL
ncbi:hypothetical protein AOQ84DRAFT_413578 [Glonium stellatum]|uniref:C2H2-type domain-containing protein n=1 Tax=Glonium stellatum TaxID=574774 RepID=A0A8E2EVN9_9PEZI|nr:hypothetical protein AOQ84DRAFT_413578 [Glonium stellatum]